jgi:A/G-specific adenine glycosylase
MLLRRADFARQLLGWYDRSQRSLPWRGNCAHPAPTAYHVLVSEFMLQQTQVATVIPFFNRFIAAFPTLPDLARADEQQVLRHWQGLGYYTRARNLLKAARQVVRDHGGELPGDVGELQKLAGVGRYTAGAVSSIAFGKRAPILDANVVRVLCRLDRVEADPRDRAVREVLWKRAEEILPDRRIGDFNSAMMELGALICIPRAPRCELCPVRRHCQALAAGLAQQIPAPRAKPAVPLLRRQTFCIQNRNRWLIEQRPATGRWAGMWQFITRPSDEPHRLPLKTTLPRRIGSVSHTLTHRRYEFEVFACAARSAKPRAVDVPTRWTTLPGLRDFPLPGPHVHIASMLRDWPRNGSPRSLRPKNSGLTTEARRTWRNQQI